MVKSKIPMMMETQDFVKSGKIKIGAEPKLFLFIIKGLSVMEFQGSKASMIVKEWVLMGALMTMILF